MTIHGPGCECLDCQIRKGESELFQEESRIPEPEIKAGFLVFENAGAAQDALNRLTQKQKDSLIESLATRRSE